MTNPQAEMRQQLMNALYKDNFTTVDELLNKGVNINLPYNHSGWTPFMWVCKEHCDPDIIEKFLQYNPNINLKNKEGSTALHIMARYRSSFDCLALLIKKGANVDAQDIAYIHRGKIFRHRFLYNDEKKYVPTEEVKSIFRNLRKSKL